MPVNCLLILHSYGGGAEKVCLTLLQHLPPQHFALQVGCIRAIAPLREAVPQHIPCTMPQKSGIGHICKNLYTLWRKARASDCVVGTLELQSIFWAALWAPHKTIGWLHKDLRGYSAQKSRLSRWVYMRIFAWSAQRCDCIVCVSKGVQEAAQHLFPALRDTFLCQYNPIDIQKIQAQGAHPLPDALQCAFERKVILSVGRLAPQKNYQALIQAHALLRRRGGQQHLCILGEGPERARLEALCRTLHVEDSVFLPGFMRPYSAMRHATVFVMTSHFEGMPLVLVEALASGLPVVSVDCPSGPREVLGGGQYGVLVPVGDTEALVHAVLPSMTEGSTAESERIARGKQRALDFDLPRLLEEWGKILQKTAL